MISDSFQFYVIWLRQSLVALVLCWG